MRPRSPIDRIIHSFCFLTADVSSIRYIHYIHALFAMQVLQNTVNNMCYKLQKAP